MNDRLSPGLTSRSAAVKARLDHPVIDTDVHVNDYAPGARGLRPAVRRRQTRRCAAPCAGDRASTPARRRQGLVPADPTPSAATTAPCARRGGRASPATRSIWRPTRCPNCCTSACPSRARITRCCFPTTCWRRWVPAEFRQPLHRALNHFHADQYRRYADRLTPVAGIPLNTPQEGIEELEFAVKTLGLKVINIPGGVRRPIRDVADKYPAAEHPLVARHAHYIDFYGIDSEHDYDPFWAKVVELGRAGYDALRQPGLDRPAVDQQLHVQSHRPLRRRLAGLRQGAVLRRCHAALPGAAGGLARGRRRLGRARLHAPAGPLGQAQPRGGAELRPGARRCRPARATCSGATVSEVLGDRPLVRESLVRDCLGISALPHSREPVGDETDDFAARRHREAPRTSAPAGSTRSTSAPRPTTGLSPRPSTTSSTRSASRSTPSGRPTWGTGTFPN